MEDTTLTGNLGSDPILRYTDTGKAVANFNLTVNSYQEEQPTWYKITLWENDAENANKYLNKGDKVLVRGRLSTEHYTNEASGENHCNLALNVRRIEYLSFKKEAEESR